jgi:hypothetical protein
VGGGTIFNESKGQGFIQYRTTAWLEKRKGEKYFGGQMIRERDDENSFSKHLHFPLTSFLGRAVAQAVSRWFPTAAARVRVRAGMWDLWWTKRHWFRFCPSTSVSPANHSTNFSIIIITRVWHNRPIGGRSAEWTQLDSIPHYTNYKNFTSHLQMYITASDFPEIHYF